MKRFLAIVTALVMTTALLSGCGASKETAKEAPKTQEEAKTEQATEKKVEESAAQSGKYKDGEYHAEQKDFDANSGWKSTVDLKVVDGKIVSAYWSGIHKDGGDDKYKQSKDGKYGMKEKGKASAEWHEQADKVVAYFLEKQDPEAIQYKDEEGHTDAISGATIHVKDFFDLAKEALAKAK